MEWSKYQNDVFDFIISGTGNGFVNAGPGSGKTTVIEEAVKRVPYHESVLVSAFSCDIRDELDSRLGHMPNVTVANFNGFGNRILRKNVRGYVKLDKEKLMNILFFECFNGTKSTETEKKLYYKIRYGVCKLIDLCKSHMLWRPSHDELQDLMDNYDIELPSDVQFDTFIWYVYDVLAKSWEKTNKIDFTDQLAMPIYFDWDVPTFDWIFVDESQDLNPIQIEMMFRACAGRAIFVGDPRQAIFQFRGADKRAVQTIIDRFRCTTLPLSICYRCSAAVVTEASKIYPDIQMSPTAVPGSVTSIPRCQFRSCVDPGDFVLCRTGAPLVSECLDLIAAGHLARVRGKDLGEDLEKMLPKTDTDISQFIAELQTEYEPQMSRLSAAGKNDKAAGIQDKIDCLKALASRCDSTEGIRNRIREIFSQNAERKGITLMTVHKAKGLEAPRVYILHPELMPHPKSSDKEAEQNIRWVATTRAKSDLTYVVEPPKNETRTRSNGDVS